jgi:translation elongation factor P/translation initiation factor 5A
MAMLEYNEILPKRVILLDGQPYEVLDAHVFRKQQRKPVNQTKLRHLITGKVTEQAFHVSEKVEEADLSTKSVKFLFANRGEWWFCADKNPGDRFMLSQDTIGPAGAFLKPNTVIEALVFDDGAPGQGGAACCQRQYRPGRQQANSARDRGHHHRSPVYQRGRSHPCKYGIGRVR